MILGLSSASSVLENSSETIESRGLKGEGGAKGGKGGKGGKEGKKGEPKGGKSKTKAPKRTKSPKRSKSPSFRSVKGKGKKMI